MSDDFGNNFLSFDSITKNDLNSVCFTNENTGWFLGMNGTILKKMDGNVTSLTNNYNQENADNFFLQQNFPNPFNPSTKIKFQIFKTGYISLKVFDLLGHEVANLVDETKSAGTYEVEFDAIRLSSGIYFYRIRSGDFTETKKMLFLK